MINDVIALIDDTVDVEIPVSREYSAIAAAGGTAILVNIPTHGPGRGELPVTSATVDVVVYSDTFEAAEDIQAKITAAFRQAAPSHPIITYNLIGGGNGNNRGQKFVVRSYSVLYAEE